MSCPECRDPFPNSSNVRLALLRPQFAPAIQILLTFFLLPPDLVHGVHGTLSFQAQNLLLMFLMYHAAILAQANALVSTCITFLGGRDPIQKFSLKSGLRFLFDSVMKVNYSFFHFIGEEANLKPKRELIFFSFY